jgi:hypothetical protein
MKNLQKLARTVLEDNDMPMSADEILESINESHNMSVDVNSSQLDIVMQRHSKPTMLSISSYVPNDKYFRITSTDPYTYTLLDEDDDENDLYTEPDIFEDNDDEEDENEFIEVDGLTVHDETEDDCIRFEIEGTSVTLSLKNATKIYEYLGDLLEEEDN